MKSEIHRESCLLPAAVFILAVMQVIDSSPIWKLLLVALGGLWLTCNIWARQLSRSLTVTREMRFGWAQVGDILEERFTLQNNSLFPALWVEIIDHSEIPGYNASVVSQVASQSKSQVKRKGVCTKRGLFTLGPTSLLTCDPFGIYTVRIHDQVSTTIMVTPPVVPLPRIHVAPGGRAGAGSPRRGTLERTVSASSVRDFQPGDSWHMIHWRTSAHRDSLFVRLFDSTPASDWWIFVDMNAQTRVGEGWESTIEHGIVTAASLTGHGLKLGKSVGMLANSREPIWLSPKRSEVQLWSILRALALAESGSQPAGDWLARNTAAIGQRTSLVMITSDVQADWIEPLLPLLWKGVAPTILLLDPRSFGGRGDPSPVVRELNRLGIACYIITAGLLDRPEAQPGEAGKWEWRVTPTGRAVAVKQPADMAWKTLE